MRNLIERLEESTKKEAKKRLDSKKIVRDVVKKIRPWLKGNFASSIRNSFEPDDVGDSEAVRAVVVEIAENWAESVIRGMKPEGWIQPTRAGEPAAWWKQSKEIRDLPELVAKALKKEIDAAVEDLLGMIYDIHGRQ